MLMHERFAVPREIDIDVYDGEAIASVFGTEIGVLTFYEFDDHLVVSEVSIVEDWQREGIATEMAYEVVGEKQKPMYHGFFETEEGRAWAESLVRSDPEWHKMSSVKKVEQASSSKIAMDEDAWLDLAENFDSFEEFSRAISIEGVRPRAWHLSDDLNFEPDPDFHPLDRSGAETYNPVLFLTAYPVLWTDEHYLSDRAIAVEYDITDLRFGEDYISDQSGNEGLVVYPHAYDKLREIGRYNVSVAEDRAELQQQSAPKSKEEARRIYNEFHGVVSTRRFSKRTTASMYECNICGKQFDSLGKAKSHVKRVHKIGIEYERKVITSETGTTVVLLDTEHPDSVISPEDGGRWALLCDDHQIIVQDTNKRRLIDIMYESSFWCEYCEQIVRG